MGPQKKIELEGSLLPARQSEHAPRPPPRAFLLLLLLILSARSGSLGWVTERGCFGPSSSTGKNPASQRKVRGRNPKAKSQRGGGRPLLSASLSHSGFYCTVGSLKISPKSLDGDVSVRMLRQFCARLQQRDDAIAAFGPARKTEVQYPVYRAGRNQLKKKTS